MQRLDAGIADRESPGCDDTGEVLFGLTTRDTSTTSTPKRRASNSRARGRHHAFAPTGTIEDGCTVFREPPQLNRRTT
jgi:hypothetical protein